MLSDGSVRPLYAARLEAGELELVDDGADDDMAWLEDQGQMRLSEVEP